MESKHLAESKYSIRWDNYLQIGCNFDLNITAEVKPTRAEAQHLQNETDVVVCVIC